MALVDVRIPRSLAWCSIDAFPSRIEAAGLTFQGHSPLAKDWPVAVRDAMAVITLFFLPRNLSRLNFSEH